MVWYFFFTPLSGDRVKEPFQPFFCPQTHPPVGWLCSDFHPRPARILTDRPLRELSPTHGDGSPVLTREPFARMSTSLPRRLGPVHALLASRTDGGLRPFIAGSALTLAVSRPARRSLMFQPACSLAPLGDLLHQRLRPGPLPSRAAPVTSGWSNSCRVGYLPPTGFSRPFHGAR